MSLDISLKPSLLAPHRRDVRCPKCGGDVRPTGDRDTVWCVQHGDVFVGVPRDKPDEPRWTRPGGMTETDGVKPQTTHLYSVRVDQQRKATAANSGLGSAH